jgi:Zn-dependent protease
MNFSVEYFILRIPAILLALTVHECAHGWVAMRFGDRTAYDSGRVTLNPFVHLDLLGTVMLLFGPFGWAKPVPVDPRYFKDYRKGILYVSAAGPVSNVALAMITGYLLRAGMMVFPQYFVAGDLRDFIDLLIMMNIGIAFFNLLPVPPLDGSKILLGLIPQRMVPGYVRNTRYLPTIFMGLLLLEWVVHVPVFSRIIYPLFTPFYSLVHLLIFWRLP